MILDIQFKIKNNPILQTYLREHSDWYKILNRNPKLFQKFEEEAKIHYKLRPTDRINKVLETIEMFQTIMSQIK